MGWWVIDPNTGEPKRDAYSKLSNSNEKFVNAFPGIDDDPDGLYLGDAPMDAADDAAERLVKLLGEPAALMPGQIRDLADPNAPAGQTGPVQQVVADFWQSIETAYQDDWGRSAKPAERHWCRELIVSGIAKLSQTNRDGTPIDRVYELNVSEAKLWLGLILFGAAGIFFEQKAALNTRGLIIDNLITLDPAQATIAWWCLAVASFVMAALSGISVLVVPFRKLRVVLTAAGISAPRWILSPRPTLIAYRDIRRLQNRVIHRAEFLTIVHSRGKLHLNVDFFESRGTFNQFQRELVARLPNTPG